MIQLVLFDIDGTLIRSGGAGVRAFAETFAHVFNLPKATETVRFCGRTDVSLVRECFVKCGLPPSKENFARFFDAYPVFLERNLKALPGAVCEGISTFLHALSALQNRPVLGLLTGNIRRGAELKLTHYRLWDRFETGAFADDHEDRNCIAAAAKRRGEERLGRGLRGEEIVVIGDTPHDIACGQSIGAKVLAVGTGNFTAVQLREFTPDWAVDHLGQLTVTEVLGHRNGSAKITASKAA